MVQLKIFVVIIIAVLVPVVFFKTSKFLSKAFLEEESAWSRWRVVLRINMIILVIGYMIGVVIFSRDLFRHINEEYFYEKKTKPDSAVSLAAAGEHRFPAVAAPAPELRHPDVHGDDRDYYQKGFQKDYQKSTPPQLPLAGVIMLDTGPRFSANWESGAMGLRIVRLGNGPMKDAGMRIGDIITHVNGVAASNAKNLLTVRDRVYAGSMNFAEILVLRENITLRFQLTR